MPIRPLGPSQDVPPAVRDWTEQAAAAFALLENTVRGQPPAPRPVSVEQLERLEGEQALNESALAGLRGEAARAAAERLQAARGRATLEARVAALEARANIGQGAIDAGIDPLAPPGLAAGEEPAPVAPAVPDYLGAGGVRVLVASTPLFYTDTATQNQDIYPVVARDEGTGAPDWTRAASAPAAMYLVAAAEGLSPLGITAAGASGFLRWEWEIRANDGAVQATLRVPVRQAGSATAAIPYTNGSATSVVSYTATNRLSIAADGARAVGDTICVPQNDAPGLTPLAAGHTFPNDCRVYLVPVP